MELREPPVACSPFLSFYPDVFVTAGCSEIAPSKSIPRASRSRIEMTPISSPALSIGTWRNPCWCIVLIASERSALGAMKITDFVRMSPTVKSVRSAPCFENSLTRSRSESIPTSVPSELNTGIAPMPFSFSLVAASCAVSLRWQVTGARPLFSKTSLISNSLPPLLTSAGVSGHNKPALAVQQLSIFAEDFSYS